MERSNRTEIDFLNGYICDRGKELGVPTPVNDAVRAMVLKIEANQRQMGLDNVNELLKAS
jgi:2-dehydropantoate 2-reductase